MLTGKLWQLFVRSLIVFLPAIFKLSATITKFVGAMPYVSFLMANQLEGIGDLLKFRTRYLTIIPRARMGSAESIAHETEGRMGY